MTLTSHDFEDGRPIPRAHAYTGEGENRPPRLAWSHLPPGTVELALIVDDPDAPRPEPWVHDVLYNIPTDATPETMVLRGATVDSARRFLPGVNSWGEQAWGGPFPPPGGPHRYVFTLYALDAVLDLPPGATKEQLLQAMEGHVLGTAVLVGTYRRE
ncbi:MAG: YbhB/YbcL family Raf kinase inhibitor-like protein [Deltaproteobacteria bacterium]|nr:YbhB/YbcL family Raf kinase inhibitor-like protein [Deltaproteobacteria bacterium]